MTVLELHRDREGPRKVRSSPRAAELGKCCCRINAVFAGDLTPGETMMQVPDTSVEALPVAIFRRKIDRRGPFDDCIRRYSQEYLLLMMQSAWVPWAALVHQRCHRWLLMTHDRVRHDSVRLSHEFLAMTIGSTRPMVSLVAGTCHT